MKTFNLSIKDFSLPLHKKAVKMAKKENKTIKDIYEKILKQYPFGK